LPRLNRSWASRATHQKARSRLHSANKRKRAIRTNLMIQKLRSPSNDSKGRDGDSLREKPRQVASELAPNRKPTMVRAADQGRQTTRIVHNRTLQRATQSVNSGRHATEVLTVNLTRWGRKQSRRDVGAHETHDKHLAIHSIGHTKKRSTLNAGAQKRVKVNQPVTDLLTTRVEQGKRSRYSLRSL
jgi:hypothetical protein